MVVGVLATLSVALAAGALSAPAPSTSGGAVAAGGSTASGWGAGGVLWLLVLAAVVVGGAVLLVAQVRAGGGLEPLSRRFVGLVLAVGAFVAGALLVALRVVGDGDGPRRQEGPGGPLVQGAPEPGATASPPGAGGVLAVLVAVGVLVVACVAYRRFASHAADSDDGDDDAGDAVDDGGAVDESALGAAAGQAAASLGGGGAPADNEVVRAWRSLAAVLPVSRPASSTPREFAAAATDAGVDDGDVEELTALFEAVRYGDRPADDERARRAVAALERIRAAHGDNGDETVDDGGDGTEEDEGVGRDAEGSS